MGGFRARESAQQTYEIVARARRLLLGAEVLADSLAVDAELKTEAFASIDSTHALVLRLALTALRHPPALRGGSALIRLRLGRARRTRIVRSRGATARVAAGRALRRARPRVTREKKSARAISRSPITCASRSASLIAFGIDLVLFGPPPRRRSTRWSVASSWML